MNPHTASDGLEPPADADPQQAARIAARVRERQADQVLAFLQRLPYSYLGVMLVVVLAYRHGLRLSLALWTPALLALTLYRWQQGRRVQRLPPAQRVQALPRLWFGFTAAGLLLSAIVPFVFAAPGDDFAPLAISAVLILVLALGSEGVAGSQRAFVGLATPPSLLMSLGWFARGTWLDALLGLSVWLVYFLLLAVVRDRAKSLYASMRLIDANARLSQLARDERDRARAASDAKTRFLASASHDLRQPLQAISLFGTTLEHTLAGRPEHVHAQRLMNAVRSLSGSLDAMLDISQLDAGVVRATPRPVALQALLEQLFELFEPQANARELELRVRATPLWVRSDGPLLQRLLGNLIDNALKYTVRGGVIVRARSRGPHVWLEVRDTGIGIAPPQRARIFEEFYQIDNPGRDRSRGLGVGLSIVQRLSTLLDHPLEVHSRPGHGTRLRLRLPAMDAPPNALMRAPMQGPMAAGVPASPGSAPTALPRRVLVLDDEADVRAAMLALLNAFGIEAQATADPGDALRALHAARAQGRPFDVALCDWRLAGGTDGLAAALRLREAGSGALRVWMVTGETDPQQLQQLQAMALPVLFKPVQIERLMAALAQTPRHTRHGPTEPA